MAKVPSDCFHFFLLEVKSQSWGNIHAFLVLSQEDPFQSHFSTYSLNLSHNGC